MTPFSNTPQHLAELVAYLFTRREAILNQWRSACEQDPVLSKVTALSRDEFNNLLPLILDILEERLLNKPPQADMATTAQVHGLNRWHKAYGLMETLNELNHLTQTLNSELRLFEQLFSYADLNLLLYGQQHICQLMQETINGSVQKYDEMQRLQAASRVNALQEVVGQLQELSQQRGDALRESTHDIRSSFGLVYTAADLLQTQSLSDAERTHFMGMLNRNLSRVQELFTGLMDLSRLEAGQEGLHVESVDAAQLLTELVASVQPIAIERGIALRADGPPSLVVETDRIKLERVAQNLLVNALKYTPLGPSQAALVSISWSVEGEYRWVLSIQDSGPGLPTTLAGALSQQFQPTLEQTSVPGTSQVEQPLAGRPEGAPPVPAPGESGVLSRGSSTGGEGVGLQIVKRLCELLNANLDVETKAGRGTLFRIRLPIHLPR